ncbi:MAG: hypothetical protein JXR78_08835 [Victivallales bacterium]|nr:hypothetical protein [Victivallales bacterium]
MEILVTIIIYCISILFAAFALWAGMKITKLDGKFIGMLVIASITSLIGLIPGLIGTVAATIAMFVLICKWTTANFWPDAVLMVVVARLVEVFMVIGLTAALLKLSL